MILYCCDICKTTHNNIGEMKTVIVRNSGPQDGEYHICKNCEPMLNGFLYELLNYDLLSGEVVINND